MRSQITLQNRKQSQVTHINYNSIHKTQKETGNCFVSFLEEIKQAGFYIVSLNTKNEEGMNVWVATTIYNIQKNMNNISLIYTNIFSLC